MSMTHLMYIFNIFLQKQCNTMLRYYFNFQVCLSMNHGHGLFITLPAQNISSKISW